MTIDILPTIAKRLNADLPDHPIDGLDIWPLIAGEEGAKNPHDAYWFYYKRNELHAVLSGDWKLYLPHSYRTLNGRKGGTGGLPVKYDQAECGLALFNIREDIGENDNLAGKHPEIVERLMKHVEAARKELGDRLTKREGSGLRQPGQP